MPSIISHAAVPLALGLGLGKQTISPRLLIAGVAASMLPDLDVAAFRFGIPYAHAMGHRGMTHSLLIAACAGLLCALFARKLDARAKVAGLFIFVCMASHGVLDALTTGGLGIAFLWPFSHERYFAPVRPIAVSPLGIARFFSPRGLAVLRSELLWVWAPCALIALGLWLQRRPAGRTAAA